MRKYIFIFTIFILSCNCSAANRKKILNRLHDYITTLSPYAAVIQTGGETEEENGLFLPSRDQVNGCGFYNDFSRDQGKISALNKKINEGKELSGDDINAAGEISSKVSTFAARFFCPLQIKGIKPWISPKFGVPSLQALSKDKLHSVYGGRVIKVRLKHDGKIPKTIRKNIEYRGM